MSSKQARFERFLEAQERKEQANFRRDLRDDIMPTLARVIKEFAEVISHPNWKAKTLPQLRAQYKDLQGYLKGESDHYRAEKALSTVIFHLNSWNRQTGKKLELRREIDPRYHGKAAIVTRFWLEVSRVETNGM